MDRRIRESPPIGKAVTLFRVARLLVTDGTSNTVFAGEVKGTFRPWGDVINWRDLRLGINVSPDGFGGPFKGGCNLLLGDGSVRFVSDGISPEVLKALSTPKGNEPSSLYKDW